MSETLNAEEDGIDGQLKGVDKISKRQEIISDKKKTLRKALLGSEEKDDGDQAQKSELVKAFEQTNFEQQVNARLNEIAEVEAQEVLGGLQELQERHMREFETQIRAEREGPLHKRKAYASALVRSRILEEATDLDKVRKLYGTVTAGEFAKEQPQKDAFKTDLLTQVEERFGINSDGVEYTENMDESNQDKIKSEAISYHEHLREQIDEILEIKETSEEFVGKIEDDNKPEATKEALAQNLKVDILMAKIRRQYTNADESQLSALRETFEENPDISDEKAINIINQIAGGSGEVAQKIVNDVEQLFDESDGNNFEVIATPTGLAVIFQETSKLNQAILGDPNANSSIAAILNESPRLKSLIGENWKGEIMLIASDGNEEDLAHEIRHGLFKRLDAKFSDSELDDKQAEIKDVVEELAIKISTGELWMEEGLPIDPNDKLLSSLAALGYIDSEFVRNNPEEAKKLFIILEMTRKITQTELQKWGDTFDIDADDVDKFRDFQSQNIYGEAIGNILLTNRNENGTIDLDKVIQELQNKFPDEEDTNFDMQSILNKYQGEIPNFEYKIFGFDNQEEMEQAGYSLDELNQTYGSLRNDKEFTFNVIPYKSLQSRPSRTQALSFENDHGLQPPGEVGIGSAVGGFTGLAFHKAFDPLGRLFDFDKKKPYIPKTNPGPLGYHVGGPLNYAGTGKALQGIVRRVRNIPIIGLPLKLLIDDRRLVSATDARLFRAPPMGELNELIVKEYFPGLNSKLKKWFPGAPRPYENLNTTAGEVFNGHLNVIQETLGQSGLGLSNAEIQRIMGELPHVLNEPDEFGRQQNETSRNVFDKLEVTERKQDGTLIKKHRGRITSEFITGVKKYEMFNGMNDVKELAEHMRNVYTYDSANPDADNTYAYTMNDLMTASELVHDLGINPNNPSRIKSPKNDNYKFDRRRGLMIGDHTWYDPKNPEKRGVMIQGKDFDLKTVKKFIELYNNYHIYKALREGIPEISEQMRTMEYLPNFEDSDSFEAFPGEIDDDGNIIVPPRAGSTYNIGDINFIPEHLIEQAISRLEIRARSERATNRSLATRLERRAAELKLKKEEFKTNGKALSDNRFNNRVVAQNPRTGELKYYELSPEKNKYFNPRSRSPYGFGGGVLPGFGTDLSDEQRKAIANNYLGIAKEDFEGWNANMEKGLGFYDTWMSYYAAAKEYERKGKFASVFWGEISKWTGRIGNAVMLSSLITLSFTGAPLFAGILLGAGAYQFLVKEYVDHHAEVMKARRKKALEAIGSLEGRQSMFQNILQGKPPSKWELESMEQAILTMEGTIIEPMAAAGPEPGKAPNDITNQVLKYIFGQDGLLPKQFAG